MKLGKYLKSAFFYHWNLLAFGTGLALGAVTGRPDIVWPLVMAGEVAYLGMLGTHPKFQKYVDAQEAKATRTESQSTSEQTMRRLLLALPQHLVQKFEGLRQRCAELRQLAQEIRDPNRVGEPMPLEELQLQGLDRLLWIYMRLLYTQYSLERFLQKTSEPQIQRDIDDVQVRLTGLGAGDDPQKQKMRKALEDSLETSKARLVNWQKARDNYELVKVEAERLENKIRSLSEIAVNRHEPDFIAGQVDQVVNGMVQTERTMSELEFVTGLKPVEDEVPEMLRREPVVAKQTR